MLYNNQTFSGFSVANLDEAENFYGTILGLQVVRDEMGLHIHTTGNNPIFAYQKVDHQPASFTILNFEVEDIDSKLEEMVAKGIVFEQYDLGNDAAQDEKRILRGRSANMGPDIAWFKDPSGNILSIVQN